MTLDILETIFLLNIKIKYIVEYYPHSFIKFIDWLFDIDYLSTWQLCIWTIYLFEIYKYLNFVKIEQKLLLSQRFKIVYLLPNILKYLKHEAVSVIDT